MQVQVHPVELRFKSKSKCNETPNPVITMKCVWYLHICLPSSCSPQDCRRQRKMVGRLGVEQEGWNLLPVGLPHAEQGWRSLHLERPTMEPRGLSVGDFSVLRFQIPIARLTFASLSALTHTDQLLQQSLEEKYFCIV